MYTWSELNKVMNMMRSHFLSGETHMSQSKYGYLCLIFFCAILLLLSLSSANANQGPNVSLGSNPIRSWSAYRNSDGWQLLETLSTDLVITDLTLSSNSECFFILSDQNNSIVGPNFISAYSNGSHMYQGHFQSGVKIPSGTDLYLYVNRSSICNYTLSGYASH